MMLALPILAAALAATSVGSTFVNTTPAPIDTSYLSVAVGAFDVFDNAEQNRAVDMRLEYRPNSLSLYKRGILNIVPFVAVEATSEGSVWGGGGLAFDMQYHSVYMTPSFGIGAYHSGGGKDLGSAIEFRSQIEAGYEFDNQSRLGVSLSHTSNAGIGDENPGVEVISLYYHHPVNF